MRHLFYWGLGGLGLFTVLWLSIVAGLPGLGFGEASRTLILGGDGLDAVILRELRLPRALLGMIIGAGLGASGAALQGFTRNDLAAPGLLGFSACAALGAVATLYFGLRHFTIPAAILSAGLGAMIMAILSRRRPGASGLILAGIGIGAMATAFTGLLMNLAPNPWALSEMVYWLMGSLKHADRTAVLIAGPLGLIGIGLLILSGPALRALTLGEDTAHSLGISMARTQGLIVAGTALAVGSGVAVAGAIGFVGLFVPHILRGIIGADPARLIPASALTGGAFLVIIDALTRAVSGPGTPLYLGIVTSLIGVPVFLWIAVRQIR